MSERQSGQTVGFTGTRNGMTASQKAAFDQLMWGEFRGAKEFHHGCCLGADTQAALTAESALGLDGRIVGHPCTQWAWVSDTAKVASDDLRPASAAGRRSADIVAASDALIACPDGPERAGSGTWNTIRQAASRGVPVVIVWPDGRIERRQPR